MQYKKRGNRSPETRRRGSGEVLRGGRPMFFTDPDVYIYICTMMVSSVRARWRELFLPARRALSLRERKQTPTACVYVRLNFPPRPPQPGPFDRASVGAHVRRKTFAHSGFTESRSLPYVRAYSISNYIPRGGCSVSSAAGVHGANKADDPRALATDRPSVRRRYIRQQISRTLCRQPVRPSTHRLPDPVQNCVNSSRVLLSCGGTRV